MKYKKKNINILMIYSLHSTSKQQRLIEVFQPEKGKSINKCIVLFPGGGYTQIAWDTQILTAAAFLNKLGNIVLYYYLCIV